MFTKPCGHFADAARWNGAIVAVKLIQNVVEPGKSYDLMREPLLW